ncbi:PEP-CTERM sorting domain-containing protein [Mastigocoleus sp. MO_188.B34]|uniref:PEP-CTERM sorting domain-containing protein n=1 Tax=Mastigocoleus sp. MO_188.B34 TaxID=3036635 RepID=UPI0026263474|nr:PEP-CTERM sorting domain-containing protein [Mastigocoleus sp. MO_188.B34]MDJ0693460.1 PEP-CTERM sorting domain-containing protein [Mastigocoleus sp. MO_188.B34]
MHSLIKNFSRILLGTALSVSVTGILNPSQTLAESKITSITPAPENASLSPDTYDVYLDANDPLSVDVQVKIPTKPIKLDLFLLEDVSGSFVDDLKNIQNLVPSLVDSVKSTVSDAQFGVGSFIDKPMIPFGNLNSFVYKTDLGLTSDVTKLQTTINNLFATGGNDFPESQLEALLQTAVRGESEIGFREDAFKVVVLSTDARFHKAGDYPSAPANNGDAILDGSTPGTGEDYPAIEQVKQKLEDANIIPIFAVTKDVRSDYENLVDTFGFGSVVDLSSDSSNLINAINIGLSDVFKDITLDVVGDDFGYVANTQPRIFSNVPSGESRTFNVTLLADGINDKDDSLSLVAPGFAQVDINVDVKDPKNPIQSVPEPSTIFGLLVVCAFSMRGCPKSILGYKKSRLSSPNLLKKGAKFPQYSGGFRGIQDILSK